MGRRDYNEALITVVRLNGVLQASSGPVRSPQARRVINMDRVEKWLYRALSKDLRPAACAISINSPGGAPAQAELIASAIEQLSKKTGIKVYTFAEDVAASGGYWLLASGDQAYACETSLVGSIGVVSSSFGAVDAMQRLGIERRVWTAGDAKAQVDPFSPVQPEQEARLRDVMADVHATFVAHVRARRGGRLAGDPAELFSGRPWTGRQALALGLVDGLGDLRSVMLREFGERARFLLCSDPPTSGLRDLLGLARASAAGGALLVPGAGAAAGVDALCRGAAGAVLDELEERDAWGRYQLR